MTTPHRVILVTGLSGAGKSSALKALEDLGYEAVDNMPLSLLPHLVKPVFSGGDGPQSGALAIGIDSRTRAFDAGAFLDLITRLRKRDDLQPDLLFLEASDRVLARRFTETRRRHPLAVDRPVQDGIDAERALMHEVRDRADFLIDTSEMTGHDLRRFMDKQFALDGDGALSVTVTSFSYRRGLPRDADLVMDVRFLMNPFYEDHLRDLTGSDPGVADFIAADPAFPPFFEQYSALVLSLLPRYRREGKSYLTIALGCTGGRHRSVFVAEKLEKLLKDKGFRTNLVHRDAAHNFAGSSRGPGAG